MIMFIIIMETLKKEEPAYKAPTCYLMPSGDTLEKTKIRILVFLSFLHLGCLLKR